MALETILSEVHLDVYDHDTTPTTIKTIALDSKTRIVRAYLYKEGQAYNPDASTTVELIAIRPDKVGVSSTGETVVLVEAQPDTTGETTDAEGNPMSYVIKGEPALYGLQATISQTMLAIQGTVLFQFKLAFGEEILRTEIFKADNGRALDSDISEWADEYQGYNLDELVENYNKAIDEIARLQGYVDIKVAATVADRISVQDDTLVINNSKPDVSEVVSNLESYIDSKMAQLQTYADQAVDDKLKVQSKGIYIAT